MVVVPVWLLVPKSLSCGQFQRPVHPGCVFFAPTPNGLALHQLRAWSKAVFIPFPVFCIVCPFFVFFANLTKDKHEQSRNTTGPSGNQYNEPNTSMTKYLTIVGKACLQARSTPKPGRNLFLFLFCFVFLFLLSSLLCRECGWIQPETVNPIS